MAITLFSAFQHDIVSGEYAHNSSDDYPTSGFAWTGSADYATPGGSYWPSSESVFDFEAVWSYELRRINADVANYFDPEEGRLLLTVQLDPNSTHWNTDQKDLFIVGDNLGSSSAAMQIVYDPTTEAIRVSKATSGWAISAWVEISVADDEIPFVLEVRWDTSKTSQTETLQARVWEMGDTIPSFVGSASNGWPASTTDGSTYDETALCLTEYCAAAVGKIIVSDSYDDDLSDHWDALTYSDTQGGGGTSVAPAALDQAQSIDTVSLTQHHAIAPSPIDHAQLIDTVTVAHQYAVAVAELLQSPVIDTTTLTQHHQLAIAALDQVQTLGTTPLTQHHALTALAIDQAQTIDQTALTQHHAIALAPVDQAQAIETVALAVAGTVTVTSVDQAQQIDVVLLTQHHQVAPASLDQAQTLETSGLSVVYALTPAAIDQAQSIEATTLTLGGSLLAVLSLDQAQALDPVNLLQHNVLVVDSLVQQQILDGASFGGAVGWLSGTVVVVSALDGAVTVEPALKGAIRLN